MSSYDLEIAERVKKYRTEIIQLVGYRGFSEKDLTSGIQLALEEDNPIEVKLLEGTLIVKVMHPEAQKTVLMAATAPNIIKSGIHPLESMMTYSPEGVGRGEVIFLGVENGKGDPFAIRGMGIQNKQVNTVSEPKFVDCMFGATDKLIDYLHKDKLTIKKLSEGTRGPEGYR
ncbi:MAG: hypothetical protein WCI72_01680 [archaeon]